MNKKILSIVVASISIISCEGIENEDFSPFTEDQVGKVINENEKDYQSGEMNIERDTVFNVNGVAFKMIRVEGGSFMMGCSDTKQYGAQPVHKVTLSTFYIAETEVTQELYKAVMGNCPSKFSGKNIPVGNVTRYMANDFVNRLREKTGFAFNLPTEAQWEFAAIGGNKSRGYLYSGSNKYSDVAWTGGNSPHQVATKQANELGIYDMSGNMMELCYDDYVDYKSTAQTNPIGPIGNASVTRGGTYSGLPSSCTVYYRTSLYYDKAWADTGFRMAIW